MPFNPKRPHQQDLNLDGGLLVNGDLVSVGWSTFQSRFAGKRIVVPYGTTVAIDASLGNLFDVTVTNGSAFLLANPVNPTDGQRITITFRNGSGGTMGAITWGSLYQLAPWTNPANTNSRSIDFRYDGTAWVEVSRTPVDVPNVFVPGDPLVSIPAASNTAIQYVTPNGNDGSDGSSWTTAKKTILAAYDALPSGTSGGGTIYIAHGSFVGGEVASQGIWIVGPNDPSYNSPLAGWRTEKTVRFIGVGLTQSLQFSLGNPVGVFGGQPPNVGNNGWGVLNFAKPGIWLAGTNTGIWFENLSFYPLATAIRLGVSADQTSRNVNTSGIMFRNVAAQVINNGGGPVVDVGYAFWIYWDNCVLIGSYNDSGGVEKALTDDAHAVMLLKPDPAGATPGLFTIRNNRWAAGGLKYTRSATSAGSLYIDDLLVESDGHDLPPVVWITNLDSFWSNVVIQGVSPADAGAGTMAAVKIDGQSSASDAIVCLNVDSIQGPCTVLGGSLEALKSATVSPLRWGQVGTAGRRLVGQHDSARRRFSPTTARFTNLAQQDATLWSGLIGGATVTTGQTAPDGTLNAGLLTSASSIQNKAVYRANRTYAIGDILVFGVWVQATTPAYGITPSIGLDIFTGAGFAWTTLDGGFTYHTNDTQVAAYPFVGDGEWVWAANAAKISAIGTNPVGTSVALNVYNGCPSNFYAPIFLHIPVGTISDNEAAEIMTHLQSWSNLAPVGAVSTLASQPLALGGHLLDFGATVTATAGPATGTTPPALRLVATPSDFSGQITFGTGTTPTSGVLVNATFTAAYAATPTIVVTPINAATAGLTLYAAASTPSFVVSCVTTPTASQANTVYGFNYHIIQ